MANNIHSRIIMAQFENRIRTNWKELQYRKDFSDVILACEDKQISTHRLVISSCSSIFETILKKNLNSNPIIYLRGVKFDHLESLLMFMYQGEVQVGEEELSEFLQMANDFRIEGLSQEDAKNINIVPDPFVENIPVVQNEYSSPGIIFNQTENMPFKTECLLEEHVEEIGVDYNCDQCDYKAVKTCDLKIHILSAHQNKNAYCDLCGKNYTTAITLKRHINVVHEGKRFDCDQCNKQFSDTTGLRRHKISFHEGLRYPCDKCNYKAKHAISLKQHKNIHEGIRFPCDLCDYKAGQKSNLRTHKIKHHNLPGSYNQIVNKK